MHKVYREDSHVVMNQDEENCNTIIFIILNYLLYCGAHSFGVSYYYTYIIYNDAIENPKYNNKEITNEMSSTNLTVLFAACFIILYIQQTYLSFKITRHFLGVCLTTQICTLLYVYSALQKILTSDCENRQFLTCHKNSSQITLNNEVIETHADAIVLCVGMIAAAQTLYIIGSMIRNYKKQYFFSKTLWKEFLIYYLYYMAITCIAFILPLILCLLVVSGGGGGCSGGGDNNGDGDCQCDCFGSELGRTVTGNQTESNNTIQTVPFGTKQVTSYDSKKGQGVDV